MEYASSSAAAELKGRETLSPLQEKQQTMFGQEGICSLGRIRIISIVVVVLMLREDF